MHNDNNLTVKYAGFWFRFIAAIVDGILVQIASFIIVLPLALMVGFSMAESAAPHEVEAAGAALGFVIGILVQWLYFTVSESSGWQATLGKKMFGLRVTDVDGNKLGFGKANGRYWAKILSALILCIGFLMIAFTQKKQGLHDIIASTLVVRKS